MTERPILFSAPMVRAILAGRKTVTRRVVREDPGNRGGPVGDHVRWFERGRECSARWCGHDGLGSVGWVKCPYGEPGDRLWVRETWADVNSAEGPALAYRASGPVRPWRWWSTSFGPDEGAGPSFDYDSYPGNYSMWWSDLLAGEPDHAWRPPIYMPRWASRITLEVTDIRVERLQEIDGRGVAAEGIDVEPHACPCEICRMASGFCPATESSLLLEFRELWDGLNAKRGAGWDVNPWVWVVAFRRLKVTA